MIKACVNTQAVPTLVKLETEISGALTHHPDQLVPKLCSVCRVRLAAD
jgi:hypothetical protein